MIVRRVLVWAAALPLAILVAIGIAAGVGVQYAYEPAPDKVLSRNRTSPQAYDLWGHAVTTDEANRLLKTDEGRAQLAPAKLVDRGLRARVVAANEASPPLRRMNVAGTGHAYWVDPQSGFSGQEQQALILYMLTYEPGS
ncbi:MAG: hypothetical protein JO108_32050 [Acidobacteriaceae bacterium]|nr:hypothetical protein [Acidobacteriaceae bacterium]